MRIRCSIKRRSPVNDSTLREKSLGSKMSKARSSRECSCKKEGCEESCWCGSVEDVCQLRLLAWVPLRRLFNKGTNLSTTVQAVSTLLLRRVDFSAFLLRG